MPLIRSFRRSGRTKRYARRRYRQLGARGMIMRGRRVAGSYKTALTRMITHNFKRRWKLEVQNGNTIDLTNNISGFENRNLLFRLSQLVNAVEFSQLYDQYRINKIILEVKWSMRSDTVSGVEINNPPIMYYLRDYDDIVATTEEQFNENARTKSVVLNPNKMYKFVIVPAQLHTVYNTGLANGYAIKWKQWTDVGNIDVPHYGLKMGFKYPANEDYGSVHFNAVYYFSCKNAR